MLKRISLALLLLVLLLSAACDPLGGEAQAVVIVPTQPPTRTRAPSPTPLPPATVTPIPPTDAPSPTPFSCTEKSGQIVQDSYVSKIARGKVAYRVYLPPCYWQTNRRYPYVILLHGSDTNETQWTDHMKADQVLNSGLADQSLPPMMLVMPAGGDLANQNVFKEGASFESMILTEFMPLIEKNFCTWNAREGRAIGGISRGGFWAFEIAFRHPELFSAVGGHSPFFDKSNAPPDYNPLDLAKNVKFSPGLQPRIWIDAGKDDYARPNIELFQKSLTARSIPPGYTMNPIGQHNERYWASHISEYLAYYGQTWPHNPDELPSCLQ